MIETNFRKIAVAVDGSFHASIAARYACILAGGLQSKLFAITVITDDMNERDEKSASYSVARIIDEAREHGVDVAEGAILRGDVIRELSKFVRDNGIDMLISSTRRPQKERRFFVRSVTSGLMTRASCDVLAIKISHPGRSLRSKRVLVPVIGDGYMDKQRSDIIAAIAGRFNSSITVFHVEELSAPGIKRLEKSQQDMLIEVAGKKISSFMKELRSRGVHASEKIVKGRRVRDEIISEASHHKYDLIVLGTTKRNILKKAVSGNPVEEILRDTPCDVMILNFKERSQ